MTYKLFDPNNLIIICNNNEWSYNITLLYWQWIDDAGQLVTGHKVGSWSKDRGRWQHSSVYVSSLIYTKKGHPACAEWPRSVFPYAITRSLARVSQPSSSMRFW